jgi:hypothetical protein
MTKKILIIFIFVALFLSLSVSTVSAVKQLEIEKISPLQPIPIGVFPNISGNITSSSSLDYSANDFSASNQSASSHPDQASPEKINRSHLSPLWYWLGGFIIAIIAVLIWILKKK